VTLNDFQWLLVTLTLILSCRGLDPYIVGGFPGGRDFQLVFLALLA